MSERGTNTNNSSCLFNIQELKDEPVALRDKLWREGKIKIQGYTYSEWVKIFDE